MTTRGRRLSAFGIAVAVLAMVRVLSVLVDGSTTWRAVRAADGPPWVSQAVTPTATVTTTTATAAPTSEPVTATPWIIVITREVPVTTTPPPLRFWVEAQPGTILAGARRPAGSPDGGESWGYIGVEDGVRAAEWWAAGGYDYQVTCYDVVPTETPEPEATATITPVRVLMPWAWKPRRR